MILKIKVLNGKLYMKKKEYVAGFLFSDNHRQVVLIKKNKPEWQRGLLNGVGGKIEENETALTAMIREFKEETGLEIKNWVEYVIVLGNEWKVYFFYTDSDNINDVKNMTDETVGIYNVSDLYDLNVIPNLRWLIPMCLDQCHTYAMVNANN
jgi:8-oxo-dGTP diphosphatase